MQTWMFLSSLCTVSRCKWDRFTDRLIDRLHFSNVVESIEWCFMCWLSQAIGQCKWRNYTPIHLFQVGYKKNAIVWLRPCIFCLSTAPFPIFCWPMCTFCLSTAPSKISCWPRYTFCLSTALSNLLLAQVQLFFNCPLQDRLLSQIHLLSTLRSSTDPSTDVLLAQEHFLSFNCPLSDGLLAS